MASLKENTECEDPEALGPLETPIDQERRVIGFGLNGPIYAHEIAARWLRFGRFLSAPHPHAYLKRLPDLDANVSFITDGSRRSE